MTGEARNAQIERIGLLIVHGIGDQQRFETASGLTRAIAGALAAQKSPPRFVVNDRTAARTPEELACPSARPCDSPFEIEVAQARNERAHVHVHEAWWADLGDSESLADQLRFWIWALGQWRARIQRVSHLEGRASNTDKLMVGPKFADQTSTESEAPILSILWVRLLLAFWAMLAFLTFFSWNVLKQVLAWISPLIGSSSLITQYVGHVRIYTQDPPIGGGSLIDVGQPWRATIRRRMVTELIAMAERGYDRWYVLGHSQGSVLAFNALQETEWCLPNYLQPAQVDRLRGTPLWTRTPYVPNGDPQRRPDLSVMMPRRPTWLGDDEGVSRTQLFRNFRGLLTYGSPLDKFATLWPRVVCLNPQRDAFPEAADWINLWDATDPIGAALAAFSDPETAWPRRGLKNVHVHASALFLYSHVRYLLPQAPAPVGDTDALLDEVLPGSNPQPGLRAAFAAIPGADDRQRGRHALAYFELAVLTAALALGAGLLAFVAKGLADAAFAMTPTAMQAGWQALGAATARVFGSGYCGAVAFVVALAAATVLLAGLWRWAWD